MEEESLIENDDADEKSPYAISKSYFDFEPVGPMDSDVEFIDEVQSFCVVAMEVIRSGKKAAMNDIFGQILSFFAVKAYDINRSGGEMRIADCAIKMAATYQDLVSNLYLDQDFFELFFRKWPGHKLPEEYNAWVDKKIQYGKSGSDDLLNAWITKEASHHSIATKEVKLNVYFGASLLKIAGDTIHSIKMFHNRYYVDPGELASNKTITAMYKAMKKQLLKVYSQHQGYNTLSHKKEWRERCFTDQEKAQRLEAYRKKKLEEWEKHGDRAFLPDGWLTFLLCSYPMRVFVPGRKLTLDCLVPAETAKFNNLKHVRRAERSMAGSNKINASADSSSSTSEETSTSGVFTAVAESREKEKLSRFDALIACLKQELEQLKSNILLLLNTPGAKNALQKLDKRLVEVVLSLSKVQEEQTEYLMNEHYGVQRRTFLPEVILASTSTSASTDEIPSVHRRPLLGKRSADDITAQSSFEETEERRERVREGDGERE